MARVGLLYLTRGQRMTEQEKIEKLATKVMGWHKTRGQLNPFQWNWADDKGRSIVNCMVWNPSESWHDAGMVFDTLKQNPEQWRSFIYHLGLGGTQPISQLLRRLTPTAIAEAALKVCDQ